MDELDEIIEEIRTRSLGTEFQIPVMDVLELLGMSLEEYLRFRYNSRFGSPTQGFADLPDDFDQDSMFELVDLLEPHFPDVLQRLEAAGLHFSTPRLIEFQEFFVSVVLNRIQSHVVDPDLLDTALAGCLDPDDGYMFYMDASFERNKLIDYAIELYLQYLQIEDYPISRSLLHAHLHRCFLGGQLDWEVLFKHCFGILFPNRKEDKTADLNQELRDALKELELDYVPEMEDLKKQFRSLMLRYHPDRNPEGLERARRINESYSLLISGLFGAEKI
ncbi:MAG: J domain-containing protein [Leptospiraceae bacterium]